MRERILGVVVATCAVAFIACAASGDGELDPMTYDLGPTEPDPPSVRMPPGTPNPSDDAAVSDAAASPRDSGAKSTKDASAPNDAAVAEASTNAGSALVVSGAKIVFVSKLAYASNFGGLASADLACQTHANAASLPGVYRAWLSDATSSPATRLTQSTGPYQLVDGTIVATDWSMLTSGGLLHAIDKTEVGGAPPAGTGVCGDALFWSATKPDGTAHTGHCDSWTTSSASSTLLGRTDSTSASWASYCYTGCTGTAALVCVQQ